MESGSTRLRRDQLLCCPRCGWTIFLSGQDQPLARRIEILVEGHLVRDHPGEQLAPAAFIRPVKRETPEPEDVG